MQTSPGFLNNIGLMSFCPRALRNLRSRYDESGALNKTNSWKLGEKTQRKFRVRLCLCQSDEAGGRWRLLCNIYTCSTQTCDFSRQRERRAAVNAALRRWTIGIKRTHRTHQTDRYRQIRAGETEDIRFLPSPRWSRAGPTQRAQSRPASPPRSRTSPVSVCTLSSASGGTQSTDPCSRDGVTPYITIPQMI